MLLQDARQIVGMQRLAPVEQDRLFEREPEEFQIGLIGERARAVEFGYPDGHRGAVGDQAEAFLAFAKGFLGQHAVGDVDVRADQTERMAIAVALDLGDHPYPFCLAVVRPHDPIFGGIVFVAASDGVKKMLDRRFAILGVDAIDPSLMRLSSRVRRQAMEDEVFGRAAIAETFAKVDLDAADPADALDARKLGLALLKRATRPVPLVHNLLQALPQAFRRRGLGKGAVRRIRAFHSLLRSPGDCHIGEWRWLSAVALR